MNVEGFSSMLESCLTFEPGFYDSRESQLFDDGQPVYVLGREFAGKEDHDELKKYVSSLLWFTYRKNFPPIGGVGPTSDQGWGCMLRCAQMLMGHTLTVRHLGRSWQWSPSESKNDTYLSILKMFQDRKDCLYSLHQIAQMGVSNKRKVGDWFGPNTAAQVLKKLTIFDDWSRMSVHVALDNVLVHSDVRLMAYTKPPQTKICHPEDNSHTTPTPNPSGELETEWRPLLIIVPLRLGLREINRCYIPAFQELFKLPQFAGVLGGRPNHALYIVGMVGEKMLYLDPHFCQQAVNTSDFENVDESAAVKDANEEVVLDDSTFHCPYMLHANYNSLDPSLAVSFICLNEEDYTDMCSRLQETVLSKNPMLFHLMEERPKGFPKFVPYSGLNDKVQIQEFWDLGDPQYNSDEDFELLE
uniref:Cysteine protease n=1 Tax=Steinernema glaseri TaxID=37863 RepID=A0A1I8A6P0_9BILA